MLPLLSEKTRQKKYCTKENGGLFYSARPYVSGLLKAAISFCMFVCVLNPAGAAADIYKYKDEKGVLHFTNVRSDIRYTLYIKEAQENPDAFILKYSKIINRASEQFRLEPSLIKAVIKAESGFDHRAVSSKGARGLMQLMPDTASDMEVDDPFNPEKNIFGGTRYLSKMMERFNNNEKLALAAYNAGPDKVAEYDGVPPFKETKNFIDRVIKYKKKYEAGE